MNVIRVDEIPLAPNQFGIKARRVLDNDQFRIMNLVIEPGQAVPQHTSPVDVFFYVIGGSGQITIGGIAHAVRAGDILPCPKQIPMSLRAGEETLTVLNVKSPNPRQAEVRSG